MSPFKSLLLVFLLQVAHGVRSVEEQVVVEVGEVGEAHVHQAIEGHAESTKVAEEMIDEVAAHGYPTVRERMALLKKNQEDDKRTQSSFKPEVGEEVQYSEICAKWEAATVTSALPVPTRRGKKLFGAAKYNLKMDSDGSEREGVEANRIRSSSKLPGSLDLWDLPIDSVVQYYNIMYETPDDMWLFAKVKASRRGLWKIAPDLEIETQIYKVDVGLFENTMGNTELDTLAMQDVELPMWRFRNIPVEYVADDDVEYMKPCSVDWVDSKVTKIIRNDAGRALQYELEDGKTIYANQVQKKVNMIGGEQAKKNEEIWAKYVGNFVPGKIWQAVRTEKHPEGEYVEMNIMEQEEMD